VRGPKIGAAQKSFRSCWDEPGIRRRPIGSRESGFFAVSAPCVNISQVFKLVKCSPVASCLVSSLPGQNPSRLAPTKVGTPCAFLTGREKCGLVRVLLIRDFTRGQLRQPTLLPADREIHTSRRSETSLAGQRRRPAIDSIRFINSLAVWRSRPFARFPRGA